MQTRCGFEDLVQFRECDIYDVPLVSVTWDGDPVVEPQQVFGRILPAGGGRIFGADPDPVLRAQGRPNEECWGDL